MKTKRLLYVFVAWLAVVGGLAPDGHGLVLASVSSFAQAVSDANEGDRAPENREQKAVAYSKALYRHLLLGALWGLVVPLLILRLRLATRYRAWAERVASRRWVQVLLYAPLLLLTMALLALPSDAWDHSLSLAFGLSVQGWKSWSGDWATAQIIAPIIGTLLIWILYGVIRRSPGRWWFYFWLAAIPILLAVFFIQPVVIDPLFFKFTPLQANQPELVYKLEQVVHRGGMDIPPARMFEMNASSKLTGLNAYVTGFGASKRAVIWDTTIQKATTPEVLFVFGHEMGHYVLHHIPKEVSIFALLLLCLLYAGCRISLWMLARWGSGWGIRSLDDWASLPVLIFVLTAITLLATPLSYAISRHFEHEADRYGLEVLHGVVADPGKVAATFFEKSGEINLADPNPSTWEKICFFDHPTQPERVRFSESYDPWSRGGKPKYVK